MERTLDQRTITVIDSNAGEARTRVISASDKIDLFLLSVDYWNWEKDRFVYDHCLLIQGNFEYAVIKAEKEAQILENSFHPISQEEI